MVNLCCQLDRVYNHHYWNKYLGIYLRNFLNKVIQVGRPLWTVSSSIVFLRSWTEWQWGRSLSKHWHPSSLASWLWTQCDQLPQVPIFLTLLSKKSMPRNCKSQCTNLSLSCFCCGLSEQNVKKPVSLSLKANSKLIWCWPPGIFFLKQFFPIKKNDTDIVGCSEYMDNQNTT